MKRWFIAIAVIIAAGALVLFFVLRANRTEPGFEMVAHRGFSLLYPENTLYGGREALKAGIPPEFDVQFTADGVMVIMHDDTVDRTTNGKGKVSELNYSYIKTLDAGSSFSSKYAGEKVPTFDEYLEMAKGADYLYPELKGFRNTDDIITFTKKLVDSGFEEKCTIQVFDYEKALPYIRQVSKKIKVAALCSDQATFDKLLNTAKNDSNSMMSISTKIANGENLETCNKNKLDVSVWTIKDEKTLKKVLKLGYKIIISDIKFQLSNIE